MTPNGRLGRSLWLNQNRKNITINSSSTTTVREVLTNSIVVYGLLFGLNPTELLIAPGWEHPYTRYISVCRRRRHKKYALCSSSSVTWDLREASQNKRNGTFLKNHTHGGGRKCRGTDSTVSASGSLFRFHVKLIDDGNGDTKFSGGAIKLCQFFFLKYVNKIGNRTCVGMRCGR